jgi:hypothetical protein
VCEDRHAIVTLIVIERMAYLSVFLNIMTVMTLMTVIYGSFLDRGWRLYFRDSLSCFVT